MVSFEKYSTILAPNTLKLANNSSRIKQKIKYCHNKILKKKALSD